MKRSHYPALAFAAAAILILSVVAFKRYLPYTGPDLGPKEPPRIVLAMNDAYLVGLSHRQKTWSARARNVEIARDRTVATLTGITDGRIYDGSDIVLKVRAGRAICDIPYLNMRLDGGILIEGRDHQEIAAREATWNSATSTLRSNGQVEFRNKWGRMTSDSLVVDLRSEEMNMRNVRMLVDLKEVGYGAE